MAAMEIFIYPNTSADDDIASDAYDALSSSFQNAVNNTTIPDYQVTIRYDHPDRDTSSRSNFYDSFSFWATWNKSDVGCHLGVSNDIDGGIADGGNSSNPEDDAFVEQKEAVAGAANSSTSGFKNTCIQEAYHTFIDKDKLPSKYFANDHENEHDLGRVNLYGNVSPMASSYTDRGPGDSHDDHGSCSSGYSANGFTTQQTSCTNDSLDITYKDG